MRKIIAALILLPFLAQTAEYEIVQIDDSSSSPYASEDESDILIPGRQTTISEKLTGYIDSKDNEGLADWLEGQKERKQPFTHAQLAPVAAYLSDETKSSRDRFVQLDIAHKERYDALYPLWEQLKTRPLFDGEYKDSSHFASKFEAAKESDAALLAFITNLPHITQSQHDNIKKHLNSKLRETFEQKQRHEKRMSEQEESLARIQTILEHYARKRMIARRCFPHVDGRFMRYAPSKRTWCPGEITTSPNGRTSYSSSCCCCYESDVCNTSYNLFCVPARYLCCYPMACAANLLSWFCFPLADSAN